MFSQVSESTLHRIRWVLLVGWLLLIASFFYDPFSSYLTEPNVSWSLFHLYPDYFDPAKCKEIVTIQGECVAVQPYPLGHKIFWGIVVPAGVFIIFVFGHEFGAEFVLCLLFLNYQEL